MMPDVETDKRLYQAMVSGEYNFWKNFSLKELEAGGGGGETLNWFGLVGAMAELNHKVAWSSCLETYVFNATKVSVIFRPSVALISINVMPAKAGIQRTQWIPAFAGMTGEG